MLLRQYLYIACISIVFLLNGSVAFGQTIFHDQGTILGIDSGYVYTMKPNEMDASLREDMYINSRSLFFSILSSPNTTYSIEFILPGYAFASYGGSAMRCSFNSKSLFRTKTGELLDPSIRHTITVNQNSVETFYLGATINTDTMDMWIDYSAQVIINLYDESNNLVVSQAEVYVFSPFYGCFPQWNNHDGSITNVAKGQTYELFSIPKNSRQHTVILGNENGIPALYSVKGDVNTTIKIEFTLPGSLSNGSGDTIPCTFREDACWWIEGGKFLDLQSATILPLDSRGMFSVFVGIAVNVPRHIAAGTYSGKIGIEVYYVGLSKDDEERQVKSSSDINFTILVSNELVPNEFRLYPNYPNPFNPSTTIRYGLAEDAQVNISVFDLLGKEISQLLNQFQYKGEHSVIWNAGGNPGGVYYYRILVAGTDEFSGFMETKKLILMR